jgi:hypothetical protein
MPAIYSREGPLCKSNKRREMLLKLNRVSQA